MRHRKIKFWVVIVLGTILGGIVIGMNGCGSSSGGPGVSVVLKTI